LLDIFIAILFAITDAISLTHTSDDFHYVFRHTPLSLIVAALLLPPRFYCFS